MKFKLLIQQFSVLAIAGVFLSLTMAVFASPDIKTVRPPVKAGSWYPADKAELKKLIDGLLDQSSNNYEVNKVAMRGLIVPHAAYPYSGATAAAAYSKLKGRSYQRVILLGPAHMAGHLRGLYMLDVDAYETPLGKVPIDRQALAALRKSPVVYEKPILHHDEHSLEIQLPFLQRALRPGWRLLPILVGNMHPVDYQIAADALRPLIDESTLLVVSTDFTHYGTGFRYLPFPLDDRTAARLYALDMGAFARIAAKDVEGFLHYQNTTGITACGYRAGALLLHLLPPEAKVNLLQYNTSGELTADYSHSVSYIAAMITGQEK